VRFRPWFEWNEERLNEELQALEARGIEFRIDEKLRATRQIIAIDLSYPLRGDELIQLRAVYPDSYPFFRPEVTASQIHLPRHQARDGTLCLLPRPTILWESDWTLLRLLDEQLSQVMKAGRVVDQDALAADETEQAEPVTDYFTYHPNAAVLIDPPPSIREMTPDRAGELLIGWSSSGRRSAVLAVRDASGNVLAELSPALATLFPEHAKAKWVWLDEPPSTNGVDAFKQIRTAHSKVIPDPRRWPLRSGHHVNTVGVVFPEEVAPGRKGDGWLFMVQRYPLHTDPQKWNGYFARAIRVGVDVVNARAPELASLNDKTVAIVSAGCIGAPSAIELARAGVKELRILEYDRVDAAALVRWPLGASSVGDSKGEALKRFLRDNYPMTKVSLYPQKIGALRWGPAEVRPEWEVLREFLDGVSLVYDASAEWGVQHYVSQLARQSSIPYVMVEGRNGGWGGVVLRDIPTNGKGCWGCYGYHVASKSIVNPPKDGAKFVQPAGCADPTFTGANFDLAQIANAGVRLAVATLCRGMMGGYPDFEWDVAIIALRDDVGHVIAPRFTTYPLVRHPDCRNCS